MKKIIFLIALLLAGCSLKNESPDIWKKDTSNSFDSYKQYYLEGKTALASVSLKRALNSAKSSADLKPLAKVYLGVCALHVAVLINDKCEEYVSLSDILDKNDSSKNYYYMIEGKFDKVNPDNLPKQYKSFAKQMQTKNYKNAKKEMKKIQSISSMLVAASLIKEYLSSNDIDFLIDRLSLYGYKKPIVRWLKYSKNINSRKKNTKIDKLLKIINQ